MMLLAIDLDRSDLDGRNLEDERWTGRAIDSWVVRFRVAGSRDGESSRDGERSTCVAVCIGSDIHAV